MYWYEFSGVTPPPPHARGLELSYSICFPTLNSFYESPAQRDLQFRFPFLFGPPKNAP